MAKGKGNNNPMHHAIAFLARRDHSIQELSKKLRAKGHDGNCVETTIKELQVLGYLDDRRYAEMMIRHSYSRGQGPQKIRYVLSQNGVSDDIVSDVLAAFDGDWFELASNVRQKRFGGDFKSSEKNEQFKEKSKQMRFLLSRGFDSEQVHYAIESLGT